MREITTSGGLPVAQAQLPETYELSASLDDRWQSEMVPFTTHIEALSPDHGILIVSDSKQIYHDIRSAGINTIIALVMNHTRSGYEKFPGQDAYFLEKARKVTGSDLVPLGRTLLPVTAIKNAHRETELLQADASRFGTFLEIPPKTGESRCEAVLYQYQWDRNGQKWYVYAGGDWQYAELSYLDLGGVTNALGGMVSSAAEKLHIDTSSGKEFTDTLKDVITGKEKMTFSDYMQGGILGKMRRKKEEQKAAVPEPEPDPEPKPEPRTKAPVHTLYGTQRTYYCICPAERNKEALSVFLKFAATVTPDPSLASREEQKIQQKLQAIRQQAAMNQQIAINKQIQLRRMQARTSQMIARNSAEASAGLMDSFNKKMASDSRISENYSEAVRGVDTYTNSYGQSVDVSLGADHVYESRYGDVYGVSGTALDRDVLNALDWEEIKK